MDLSELIKSEIRDIPNFPKEGIIFRDITPVLANPELSSSISQSFYESWKNKNINGVVGIESRGFIYGMQLALQLKVPFIPVRKAGKLPFRTIKYAYDLEYGSAVMEIHEDAVSKGQNILIHDDLLATGGTALAAAELIKMLGGNISGFSFLVELSFLNGREKLYNYEKDINSLVIY